MSDSYEGFYGGSSSGLSPDSGNLTGYHMSAANMGFPGSPQTADQLHDVVNAIKHGTKVFEVTMLQPDVAETIPKQHFEEMRALMRLTGVKPSVHAPLIDAAGFGEKGWTPDGRADGERRMFDAIEKAQILDPSGNLPIVMHASNGAPGTEWEPGKDGEMIMGSSMAFNQETGQSAPITREFKIDPEHPELLDKGGKIAVDDKGRPLRNKDGGLKYEFIEGKHGVLFEAEGSIGSINRSDWRTKLTEVAQMNKHADEIMGTAHLHLRKEYSNAFISRDGTKIFGVDEKGKVKGEVEAFSGEQREQYEQMLKSDLFSKNAELAFSGAFSQAYKYGTDEQKKHLKVLAENYSEKIEHVSGGIKFGEGNQDIATSIMAPLEKQHILDDSLKALQAITAGQAPKVFKLVEEFAMGEAAKTFGNLAAKSYDKFGDKAPILAVENMYQGMAFSRAEDMRDLINKSRENFVEHLTEGGMKEKEAKKLAEDKLGVTWDVGHVNIMRKKGFTAEDVVEQTKVISKDKSMVKHIHLTDNFGYADTHLLPGMGNVPIKAIMEELEKTGRLDDMRKIVEAGGMIQHFKKLPHSMALAAMGSGIYGMKNGPIWGQVADIQGSYFGGYGDLNPATHHQYFGAGFTTMPVELGGQQAGGGSRFGGTPMA